jgi:hypothetical protein
MRYNSRVSFEDYHKWGYKKINGWPYYERKRHYPPTSPPFPREVVKKTVLALDKFEHDPISPTPPWLAEYSMEESEEVRLKSIPHVLEYFQALKAFKEGDGTYKDAANNSLEVFKSVVDEVYKNDPDSFVLLIIEAERTALINGLARSKMGTVWHKYYLHPEKISELPAPVQGAITSGMMYLAWESLAPSYDRLGRYPNLYCHEYEIYNSGVFQMGFSTNEDGQENFELRVKMKPETGLDFSRFITPVFMIEASLADRKVGSVI